MANGSEARQQSVVTFVMRDIGPDMQGFVGFSMENSHGVSICFMRETFWAILSVSAQKVKGFSHRFAGVSFFNLRRPSRTICNKQSRQRSTPEHPFGGNAVVYQN